MTKSEFVEHLRRTYYAQPKADWEALAVGNVIMDKGRGWRVTHVPPKRGYVLATNVMTGETEKLLRSRHATTDLLVTDENHACPLSHFPRGGGQEGDGGGSHHQPAGPV